MKKFLVSIISTIALAGCAYDYYAGDVKYVQDGKDCVYSFNETSDRYSADIRDLNASKKMIYRNTRCEDLFLRDHGGEIPMQSRRVLTRAPLATKVTTDEPAATPATPVAAPAPTPVAAPAPVATTPVYQAAPRLVVMPNNACGGRCNAGYKYYVMSAM